MLKRKFTVTINGAETKLVVVKPTQAQRIKADQVSHRAFREAVENKALLRVNLKDHLREQKVWDDEKERLFTEASQRIIEGERRLKKGGMKISEARALALKMGADYALLQNLNAVINSLDQYTAEAQAQNSQFNYLVSVCTLFDNEKGDKYFASLEDYLARADEEASLKAASELMLLLYDVEESLAKRPDNAFLIKYGFMNKQLQLLDKEGRLVDADGRLLDKEGRFIDKDGNFVDAAGRRVDEQGAPLEEFTEFLDDNDQPIIIGSPEHEVMAAATAAV